MKIDRALTVKLLRIACAALVVLCLLACCYDIWDYARNGAAYSAPLYVFLLYRAACFLPAALICFGAAALIGRPAEKAHDLRGRRRR